MKTSADNSKTNFSSFEFNTTLKHFAEYTGSKPIACIPYRP